MRRRTEGVGIGEINPPKHTSLANKDVSIVMTEISGKRLRAMFDSDSSSNKFENNTEYWGAREVRI